MNNRILNEVKRNRELMGLNESEVDEQLGTAIRQGIEKGKNFVKGLFNKNKPESDESENKNEEQPLASIRVATTTLPSSFPARLACHAATRQRHSIATRQSHATEALDRGTRQRHSTEPRDRGTSLLHR